MAKLSTAAPERPAQGSGTCWSPACPQGLWALPFKSALCSVSIAVLGPACPLLRVQDGSHTGASHPKPCCKQEGRCRQRNATSYSSAAKSTGQGQQVLQLKGNARERDTDPQTTGKSNVCPQEHGHTQHSPGRGAEVTRPGCRPRDGAGLGHPGRQGTLAGLRLRAPWRRPAAPLQPGLRKQHLHSGRVWNCTGLLPLLRPWPCAPDTQGPGQAGDTVRRSRKSLQGQRSHSLGKYW